MPDNHPIDDMANQHLSGHEPAFDPQDWVAMEAMLDKDQRRPVVFWWRWAGVAAAVAGIVIAVIWWTQQPSETIAVADQPAVEQKEEHPQQEQSTTLTEATEDIEDNSASEAAQQESMESESTGQLTENQQSPSAPDAAPVEQEDKPLHWLANEVEAAQETDSPVEAPAASTSYFAAENGSVPAAGKQAPVLTETSSYDMASAISSSEVAQSQETAKASHLSLLAMSDPQTIDRKGIAAIQELPVALRAGSDPIGRQFSDPKGRFIQPFIGTYATVHDYSDLDQKASYAYGLRGGVELWNNFSIETGIGYHLIEYTEGGDHDTIDNRVHLATEGSLHHLEVPTLITYHINGNAKWDAYLTAGLRHLFVQKEHYHFHYRNLPSSSFPSANFALDTIITLDVTNNGGVDQEYLDQVGLAANSMRENYAPGQAPSYRALGYLGGGIAYHLTPAMTLEGGMQYQFSLQPIGVESRTLDAFGLSLGLKYRL